LQLSLLSLIVMPLLFENVAAEAADAASPNVATAARVAASSASSGATFFAPPSHLGIACILISFP
jgi:hypothetical protein